MVEDTTLNDDPIKTNKLFAKYVHEKTAFRSATARSLYKE